MGVEALIDQLETKLREARKTPLIGGVRVDREELYDILDELRAELAKLVRPLDEDRLVRRAAGVYAPLDELEGILHGAGAGDRVRVDRERLLEVVSRMRDGARREEVVIRPRAGEYDPAPAVALVERLEALVAGAAPVPLTSEVRIQKDEVYDVLDRLRATLPELTTAAPEHTKTRLLSALVHIDELDDRVHRARPVPLTDQVRVDPTKLSRTLQRIRAAFSQGTLAALTN